MATTTNFGWTTPDDTALVKDGASAIRTLGSAIDTSMMDLKGGTTGQVLSKNSNTDMDFTWVAQDDSNAIQNALLTTTGDTIYASSASTPARLGIGSSGQVLTVSGGLPTWATPSAGANWSLLNSGGTSLSGAQTVTVSGISGKDKIMVLISGASSSTSAQGTVGVRLNGDTGSNYYLYGSEITASSSWTNTSLDQVGGTGSYIYVCRQAGNASSVASGNLLITGCNSSGVKVFQGVGGASSGTNIGHRQYALGGYYNSSSVITSISIFTDAGVNMDAGTVFVYASA